MTVFFLFLSLDVSENKRYMQFCKVGKVFVIKVITQSLLHEKDIQIRSCLTHMVPRWMDKASRSKDKCEWRKGRIEIQRSKNESGKRRYLGGGGWWGLGVWLLPGRGATGVVIAPPQGV